MDHTPQPLPDTPKEDVGDVILTPRESPETETPPATEEEQDITDDESIEHIVEDILNCYENGEEIYDTTFYKIVLGGHTETVKRVLNYMESNEQFKEIKWLLATENAARGIFFKKIMKKEALTCTRLLVILVTLVFTVILCPCFYAVHGLTCSIFQQKSRKLLCAIRLPIVFAALSHSKDMCQALISRNANTEQKDKHGNNVFHYLADFSVETSQAACDAFDLIIQFISHDDLYKMLFEEKNSQGLSPLELAAAFGSPALIRKMMNADPRITDTRLAVLPKGVIYPKQRKRIKDNNNFNNESMTSLLGEAEKESKEKRHQYAYEASTKVDYVDVTMYESKSIATRSFLLRLISNRNVSHYSVKDLTLIQRCPVIGKWIALKIKEMTKYILAAHMLDLLMTLTMVFLLVLLRQSVSLKAQMTLSSLNVQVREVVARQNNTSSVLTTEAFLESFKIQETEKQLEWILKTMSYNDLLNGLKDTGLQMNKTDRAVIFITNLAYKDKQKFVKNILKNAPVTIFSVGLQNILYISQAYSKYVISINPDMALMDVFTKYELLDNLLVTSFQEFRVNISGLWINPSKIFTHQEWQKLYCLPWRDYSATDFKRTPSFQPFNGTVQDICLWQSIVEMAEESCAPDTPLEVYSQWTRISQREDKHDVVATILLVILAIGAIVYMSIDIYEHMSFFATCILKSDTLLEMFLSVLSFRIPGSYYRKQLNIFTYFWMLFHVATQADFIHEKTQSLLSFKYTHYMLLIAIILRVIMHIHALRLLPWIGHFVVTTFMMATNLIHFSTILLVVICIFAMILHLLVVDIDCPVRQHEGYETIGKSLLSVFMLTFGHGDFDQYRINTPVIVTYVLFVIVCGLLLMNLIIAIMSATATDLMSPEGKLTLFMIEWLYEALSIEYTVISVLGILSPNFVNRLKKKSGFVVEGSRDCQKVYIKVFYCPKLD